MRQNLAIPREKFNLCKVNFVFLINPSLTPHFVHPTLLDMATPLAALRLVYVYTDDGSQS